MSGHNKWSQIKHRKGAQDAKRGRIFTKISREITIAAKSGGVDENSNFRLKAALSWAKSVNMPSDNIDRAIKKAVGNSGEDNLDEVVYEGYGPSGVAIMAECLTDNTNRSFANLRNIFNKGGGSLAQINSVSHLFTKSGAIYINDLSIKENILLEILLEQNGQDLLKNNSGYCLITTPKDLAQLSQTLSEQGIKSNKTELILIPKVKIMIEDLAAAEEIINLIDKLEEDDDVQRVFSNFDITEELEHKLFDNG